MSYIYIQDNRMVAVKRTNMSHVTPKLVNFHFEDHISANNRHIFMIFGLILESNVFEPVARELMVTMDIVHLRATEAC